MTGHLLEYGTCETWGQAEGFVIGVAMCIAAALLAIGIARVLR